MIPALEKNDSRVLLLLKIILGLCLVTPILISSSFLFPYTSVKAFAFRILVELAAVFYFYLALKYREFRPKLNVMTVAVLAFLASWVVVAIFGVNFYLSFWGNLERMLGIFGLAHFVAFFLMTSVVFGTEKGWTNLLKISVAVASIVGILAILQKFTSLGVLIPQVDRVYGTIGNAAFLASYLIFNIFFAGYLLWQAASRRGAGRLIYLSSILIQVFALFLSGTRGAFLGLAGGILVFLIFSAIFFSSKSARKYFIAGLALIFVFGGALFLLRNTPFIQKNPALQRLVLFSLQDTTAQNRFILWSRAGAAWQEKPVFGWGRENYTVAINKYFDARLNPYEAWYDRAHNFIFDYGVAGGWLGLAAYLGVLGTSFYYLVWRFFVPLSGTKKRWPESPDRAPAILFASLFVAYLIQNFLVFDTFVSCLMLFFALALVCSRFAPLGIILEPSAQDRTQRDCTI